MRLFFIRHGKASYDAPSDELRPLLPEGIEQAEDLGRILRAMDVRPAQIYTSPRLRAKETAEHIGMALDMRPEVNEACNFEFNLNKALKLATGYSDESDILFVGHNPSMSETVTEATGALVDLSTGGVACVSRVLGDRNHGAILKWLITPKLAAAILKMGDN
jgi:phosphohistidine phosphatase